MPWLPPEPWIQLVGFGDHDWEVLFTHWNILVDDQQIGHTMRTVGWLGMLASVFWFAWRSLRAHDPQEAP